MQLCDCTDEASEMNATKSKFIPPAQAIRNAMLAAQWRGVDPRNSFSAQEREWMAVARVREGARARSEAQANRELAMLLTD